jgi:FtsP/CotA-like multicopper oxidase with cupredoxin domain
MEREDLLHAGASRDAADASRRTFLEGLAAGGVLTGLGILNPSSPARASARVPELSGSVFDLTIAEHLVNFTGKPHTATLVNGALPAPLLRWREGDTVTINVHNALPEPASIHWHGVLVPANMDGVPGLSFRGIAPGQTYTYRFPVRQSGSYWYHSHSGFHEQTGLYGPLIIEPREPEPFGYDRDYVVLLSDWTDRDPLDVYAILKRQSDYFNYQQPTLGDFVRDAKAAGVRAALERRLAWARMRMNPSDLADVSGQAYTYLTNGATPAANWTGQFRPGERVRLRFINGSSMSYFDVRIPGLEMTVVAADGQYVHPVTVDEFRIAVAEVLDVIVKPAGADAFTIFAQSMDRTGYARGTLAAQDGLSAPLPELDKIVYVTMADMGHAGMAGGSAPMTMQQHPASERGNPDVDMQTMMPAPRLADPGIGLRANGRRTLSYADLRTLGADPDGREPGRSIELHLTGHMERYMWSFDGIPFSRSEPVRFSYGERLRIVLVNDTMMEHPIHLHGMWSDLEDESGAFHLRKHTLTIPPGTKRSYRVTADALGRWAYHCHMLYHMVAGMFREVRVEESTEHRDG